MIDKQFINDYSKFYNTVTQCYEYLLNSNPDGSEDQKILDLIALSTGLAIGLANRLKVTSPLLPAVKQSNEQAKPWRDIGISRATWYRDQQRSRSNKSSPSSPYILDNDEELQ